MSHKFFSVVAWSKAFEALSILPRSSVDDRGAVTLGSISTSK
jgi:hypothetical protein